LSHKEDGSPGRQRDHFIHQFRNAYMGIELMNKFGIIKNMRENLERPDSFLKINFPEEIANLTGCELEKFVYKAYFITAMFHDIGYPLEHFMKTSKSIHDYPPFYKMIRSDIKTPFTDIACMLMNSLLFKLVDKSEIEKKYLDNDHGCLSAISFLAHFYNNGTIFSLESEDQAIIEWAATAIYNHTNKYKNTRMLFSDDPISYLHRICDDLQEWERFSVILQNTSNYLKCPGCGQIIEQTEKGNPQYKCTCVKKDKNENIIAEKIYTKLTTIESKKLNYMKLCGDIEISGDNQSLEIKINYNLYKQLQLMIYDFSSIEYRRNDLEKVDKLLSFQDGFPCVILERFLSNDITEIKEYLKNTPYIKPKIREGFEYKTLLTEMEAGLRKLEYKKDDIHTKREYREEQIACAKKLLPIFYDLDVLL